METSEVVSGSAVACVVYADDTDSYMAPLTELYWSNGRLVSVHPLSSTAEVDAIYCPDCLEVFSDADARSLKGRCPNCVECPLCGVTLRAEESDKWSFVCAHCEWDSATVGLAEDDADNLALTFAQWETDEPRQDAFAKLMLRGEPRATEDEDDEDDEESTHASPREETESAEDQDQCEDDDDTGEVLVDDAEREAMEETAPAATLWQRARQPFRSDARYQRELLPTRVALAAKRSRRSRREVNEGRAGIVYKPKALPLDGDSSSRRAGGWAKKDASAIDFAPRVSLAAAPLRRGRDFLFVLEISNPKPTPIDATLVSDLESKKKHRSILSPYSLRRATYCVAESVRIHDGSLDGDTGAPISLGPADDDDLESLDSDDDQESRGPPTPSQLLELLQSTASNKVLRRYGNAVWLRCEATFPGDLTAFGLVPLHLRFPDAADDGVAMVLLLPFLEGSSVALGADKDDPGDRTFKPVDCAYRAFL